MGATSGSTRNSKPSRRNRNAAMPGTTDAVKASSDLSPIYNFLFTFFRHALLKDSARKACCSLCLAPRRDPSARAFGR